MISDILALSFQSSIVLAQVDDPPRKKSKRSKQDGHSDSPPADRVDSRYKDTYSPSVQKSAPPQQNDPPRKKARKDGDIDVYFTDTYKSSIKENEEIARKDPNNPDKQLIKLIDSARISLDGSFYDIDIPEIVDAFIRAQRRGVPVRIVTDTDNLVEKNDPTKPRLQVERLKAAGIPVKDDKRSAIMHDKFLVVDHKTVWTGGTNLTPGSVYHHNNDAIKFNSPELAADYDAEFSRLWGGQFGKRDRKKAEGDQNVIPYPEVKIGETTVKPFFSPNGNGMPAVLEELQGARSSIKFMTFSLTDKGIGDILLQKARSGVQVEGVFDTRLAANKASLYPVLKQAGIPVYRDGNEALMHHKVIIIDDSTVITGSYNFSNNAENNNNENFVIIKNNPGLAKQYLQEFRKLVNAAKYNHPPYNPPAKPEDEGEDPTVPVKPKAPPKKEPAEKKYHLLGFNGVQMEVYSSTFVAVA